MADLVRSAATCRRWRRLVSSEAAFICRTPRRAPGRFLRPLALGFFSISHDHDAAGGHTSAPRLAPTASATRLLGLGAGGPQRPSLNALVDDDGLSLDGSRLVASRNGLVVVDLRRGKHDRALKLCVCNPMTGQVDVLPPLSGKDGLGHYACTVLTADDHQTDPPSAHRRFRLVLVYSQRGFTAFRSYSPEDGAWSPEAKVSDARLGKKQMGVTRTGVVVGGGKGVYWLAKNVAFGLCLDTLHATVLSLPWARSGFSRAFDVANTLLGVSPQGTLCAVQIEELRLAATARRPRTVAFRVTVKSARGDWEEKELIQVEQFLPPEVSRVKLRWFCEKSGVVLFTAGFGDGRSEVYALNLDRQEVEKVASHEPEGDSGIGGGGGAVKPASDPWENLHGYEMDRAAYLATLGEGDGTEDI